MIFTDARPVRFQRPTALAFCVPSAALLALLELLPGPLTVVSPGRVECPPEVAPGGLVGVRVPDHGLALALLRETGPLLTSSLNPAGKVAATTFQEAQAYGLADVLLGSGSEEAGGLASTVVQLPPDMSDPPPDEAEPDGELAMLPPPESAGIGMAPDGPRPPPLIAPAAATPARAPPAPPPPPPIAPTIGTARRIRAGRANTAMSIIAQPTRAPRSPFSLPNIVNAAP